MRKHKPYVNVLPYENDVQVFEKKDACDANGNENVSSSNWVQVIRMEEVQKQKEQAKGTHYDLISCGS